MYKGLSVGVVVPAYNESRHIAATLAAIPDLVDAIVVVDDASTDTTANIVRSLVDPRLRLIRKRANCGVGGAILAGYTEVMRRNLDVAVVMAGDGQMDPADLPSLLQPIAANRADYVKGNRFAHPDVWTCMPRIRLLGNAALSLLTRPASGFAGVIDSQSGYTAVSTELLRRIDFARVYPRYGFPNDFLAHVHSARGRLAQVPVRPVYGDEQSGINPVRSILPLAWVIARSLVTRKLRESSRARRAHPTVTETEFAGRESGLDAARLSGPSS